MAAAAAGCWCSSLPAAAAKSSFTPTGDRCAAAARTPTTTLVGDYCHVEEAPQPSAQRLCGVLQQDTAAASLSRVLDGSRARNVVSRRLEKTVTAVLPPLATCVLNKIADTVRSLQQQPQNKRPSPSCRCCRFHRNTCSCCLLICCSCPLNSAAILQECGRAEKSFKTHRQRRSVPALKCSAAALCCFPALCSAMEINCCGKTRLHWSLSPSAGRRCFLWLLRFACWGRQQEPVPLLRSRSQVFDNAAAAEDK